MKKRSWIHQLLTRPVTRTMRKPRHRARPAVEVLEARRVMSALSVTSLLDDGSVGTLRWAVAQADLTAGPNTITFNGPVFAHAQTINLTGGQLELSNANGTDTITGPAAGVTVNGGGLNRVFQVDALVTASISGLTISGGKTTGNGGGVYNSGSLALTNCTVSGNSASGNHFRNRGGGMENAANSTATLTNCTLSGNSTSGGGGGLYNQGTLALANCTVSGNSALFAGGLLKSYYASPTTLANTIVAGNTFPSGASDDVGGVFNSLGNNLIGATNSNSGWIGSDLIGTSVQPLNPLLAPLGNYGGPTQTMALLPGSPAIDAGTNALIPAGVTTDQRGSARIVNGTVDIGAFESHGFTLTPVAGSTPQTSMIGTAFANPLAVTVTANNPNEPVNGGGVSFVTHPAANGASAFLSPSSGVITGGQASVAVAPNNADGSYEVVASASGSGSMVSFNLTNAGPLLTSLVVNTTSESLVPGGRLMTLREAISFANADHSGNAKITFNQTVFSTPQTINLIGGQLELSNTSESETITGPSAGVTVNAGGLSRVFQVDGLVTASISGLTITGGKSATDGGGVYNSGSLALTNCTVSDNSAPGYYSTGGGVQNSGSLVLTNCTVSGNSASDGNFIGGGGGGMFNSGTATLANCTINGNSASYGNGGGVSNRGSLALSNCTVSGNSASRSGGGVYNFSSARTTLTNCTVSGNTAGSPFYGGGGLFNNGGTLSLTNCTLSGNTASFGGGLYNEFQATATLTNCTVSGNSAGGGGGLWNNYGATATLTNCTVSANSADGGGFFGLDYAYGGGVANLVNSTLTLTNCTLSDNAAANGGGGVANVSIGFLANSIVATVTLTNCTVSGNSAVNGGGVWTEGFTNYFHKKLYATTTLTNCTVSGNSATGNGGGLGNASLGTTTLANCNVKGNSAITGGGISNQGTLNVASSNIIKNQASSAGGGISTTGGSATITDSVINSNRVDSLFAALGGGIDCENSLLSLTNCTVNANQGNGANAYGGGIYALKSTVNVNNSVVNGNKANGSVDGEGGGIYSYDSLLTLLASNVKGNKATTAYDDIFGM